MNLFTASGKKVNANKLTNEFNNSHEWLPNSFSINDVAMTAFNAPTGKANQLRFMWDAQWYKLSKASVDALPEDERMIFFTNNPVKAAPSKKIIDDSTFITITQFPNFKGLFVGTVLRASIHSDHTASGTFKNNAVTIDNDKYGYAGGMEIFGYFSQHYNKLVYVKPANSETGEIKEIIDVIKGRDKNSGHAIAVNGDKIALAYVYDPTEEQLLQYYIDDASAKQFMPNAIVNYNNKECKLKGYKLNSRNQLEVILEDNNNQISVPLEKISLQHTVLPTKDGEELAQRIIEDITKRVAFDKLSDDVEQDFLENLRNWCAGLLDAAKKA